MKRFRSLFNLRLTLEILLVIVFLLVAFPDIISTHATAQQEPEAPTALYWYTCNGPNHIGLFTNRLHIFCTTTSPVAGAPALDPAITWFAFPTAPDSAEASRFMSLLQTSVITAKPVWLYLDPSDTSGSSFGCGGANCRRVYGMEMR
ncbi:MAG TPA: hypothetical protein VLD65_02530 [Anaerolineales bacterium]|nr:hypothetical protein [Anaerolineales bacterium]